MDIIFIWIFVLQCTSASTTHFSEKQDFFARSKLVSFDDFVSAEMALQHIKFETRYDDFHPVVRRTLSTAFTLRTDLSEVTFGH